MRDTINIYTHNGLFHADDVFATALISMMCENINVKRGGDEEIPEDKENWIVFDIGGGRPKVFFFPLDRKLLGVMRYEGRQMEFNFAKFWQIVHTDFSFKEGSDYVYWHVRQENYRYVMETDIICKKEDMLFVNYEAPDGTRKHRHLFNGGNGTGIIHLYEKKGGKLIKIDVLKTGHVGCEYGEFV